MRYPLLFALPLCLASQAFAQHPQAPYDGSKYDGYQPIVADTEPNWDTAAYTCPQFIKTVKGEFRFSEYKVFVSGDSIGRLKPDPKKYIRFTFGEKDETDIVCSYKGFNTPLVMQRLKGLTACGKNNAKPSPFIACWTTDPYAGKK